MAAGLESVLTQLGTGPWSMLHILTVAYASVLIAPHTLGGAFLAPSVPFTCVPPVPANTSSDECQYKVDGTGEEEEGEGEGWIDCTEWNFDNSTFESTVTSEFQLVCSRAYLRTTYQSIYMFGVFVGAPFNGFFADRYGRKVTVTIGTWVYLAVALGSAWLPVLPALLIFRFLQGNFHAVLSYTGFILVVEIAEPRIRTVVGFSIYVVWALASAWWGGMAYLVRSWRLLHCLVTLPGLLLIPTVWMMDESPRWLAVMGRGEEAVKVLRRAARWNRCPLPPEEELLQLAHQATPNKEDAEDEQDPQHKAARAPVGQRLREALRTIFGSAFILFRTPRLRFITLILYLNYCLASMVYFGLSLSGTTLSSDPFIYMALMGLMEIPAYTLTIPIVQRFGRRLPGCGCFLLCGIALVALAFIPKEHNWAVVTLAMAGKVAITGAFQTAVFFSSELFPTEVRSTGVSTSFMMSRVGSILSPFITDFVGARRAWAPSVVFGVVSLLSAGSMLLLPETLNSVLPDTIDDLENRHPGQKKRKWSKWRLPCFSTPSPKDVLEVKQKEQPLMALK